MNVNVKQTQVHQELEHLLAYEGPFSIGKALEAYAITPAMVEENGKDIQFSAEEHLGQAAGSILQKTRTSGNEEAAHYVSQLFGVALYMLRNKHLIDGY